MPVLSRMELRGMEKGKLVTARESVIEVLETRFKEAINTLEDVPRLKQLMKQAITIVSLADFMQLLS